MPEWLEQANLWWESIRLVCDAMPEVEAYALDDAAQGLQPKYKNILTSAASTITLSTEQWEAGRAGAPLGIRSVIDSAAGALGASVPIAVSALSIPETPDGELAFKAELGLWLVQMEEGCAQLEGVALLVQEYVNASAKPPDQQQETVAPEMPQTPENGAMTPKKRMRWVPWVVGGAATLGAAGAAFAFGYVIGSKRAAGKRG